MSTNQHEAVLSYIREFRNAHGDDAPYDLIGVGHLFLAALDNLRANHVEQDFDDLAGAMTPSQREYLVALAAHLRALDKPEEPDR
ncbi:MAG: hypothetical protein KC776_16560 [Myxococcales bacterium]|nr:hypothetical protein [Myxococcales bacterium]MCB9580185.1 hypothetical protein [Polyangiaceae bacterium]